MLIGYMRVSKVDGSQSTDLQRDALRAAGVGTRRLYEDRASGRLDARPGLDAALKALRRGDHLINVTSRPQHGKHRFQGADGPRSIHRHHHAGGQVGIRHLCRARGIRARPGLRTNQSRPCIGPCVRTQRRCALQDDGGRSAPRDGRHGTKGNQSDGLCSELAITRQTLYRHVAPGGTLRKDGSKVFEGGKILGKKK
jgi:Resolvase, N terminal domain